MLNTRKARFCEYLGWIGDLSWKFNIYVCFTGKIRHMKEPIITGIIFQPAAKDEDLNTYDTNPWFGYFWSTTHDHKNCIGEDEFPNVWKKENIVPVLKKSTKNS